MMCSGCSKLSFLYTKKNCLKCQSEVIITIAVICEICSSKSKICSACLRKLPSPNHTGGCGCGKK